MKDFHDIWPYDKEQILFEGWWTGTTVFNIIRPRPEPASIWQNGSKWRVQKTDRPEWIQSHDWKNQKERRAEWLAEWEPFIPLLEEHRKEKEFGKSVKDMFIPDEHIPEYQIYMDDALKQFGSAPVAAMSIAAWTPESGTGIMISEFTSDSFANSSPNFFL